MALPPLTMTEAVPAVAREPPWGERRQGHADVQVGFWVAAALALDDLNWPAVGE